MGINQELSTQETCGSPEDRSHDLPPLDRGLYYLTTIGDAESARAYGVACWNAAIEAAIDRTLAIDGDLSPRETVARLHALKR